MKPVYVRCLNGSFYSNPVITCGSGFVTFPDMGALVDLHGVGFRWDIGDSPARFEELLNETIGIGAWARAVAAGESDEVPVPDDSSPPRLLPATPFTFQLLRPIPEPTQFDEEVRYKSRLRGEIVVDPGE